MKQSQEIAKRDASSHLEGTIDTPSSYNYGVDPNAETEVHLLDYWRAVWKRIWLVGGVVALITSIAILQMARKPDVYEAQARVQIDIEDSDQKLVTKEPVYYGSSDDPVYFNTQLQILVSPGLIRRVVRTLDLEHNPDFLNGNSAPRRSTWKTVLQMFGVEKTAPPLAKPTQQLPLTNSVADASSREDLVEAKRLAPYVASILSGLNVEPVKENRGFVKETRLVDISFQHTDPQVAAKVVNAIAETYVFANLEKNTQTTSSTGEFLQKRVAELQQKIRSDEERLVNYAKNNQIISLDANQNTVVERLAGLNKQLLEAENDRKTAEAALNAAQCGDRSC